MHDGFCFLSGEYPRVVGRSARGDDLQGRAQHLRDALSPAGGAHRGAIPRHQQYDLRRGFGCRRSDGNNYRRFFISKIGCSFKIV